MQYVPQKSLAPVDKTTGTLIQTTFNHKKFHNKQVKQNMTNKPKKREGTSPVYIKYSSNQEENYLLGESPAPFIYHFEK
jgi:hypothetical protein